MVTPHVFVCTSKVLSLFFLYSERGLCRRGRGRGHGEGGDVDVVGAEAVGSLTQTIHIRFNSSRPQIFQLSTDIE